MKAIVIRATKSTLKKRTGPGIKVNAVVCAEGEFMKLNDCDINQAISMLQGFQEKYK